MGHFQTWAREVAKSALPSRTDVASRACQVRKVPIAGCGGSSKISRDEYTNNAAPRVRPLEGCFMDTLRQIGTISSLNSRRNRRR